jgi:hypothetical protein
MSPILYKIFKINLFFRKYQNTLQILPSSLPLSLQLPNQITSRLSISIGLLPKLHDIRLFGNSLTGVLLKNLENYSTLWNLEIDDNKLTSQIPLHLCSGDNLLSIVMFNNDFSDQISSSLANHNTLNNIQLYKK